MSYNNEKIDLNFEEIHQLLVTAGEVRKNKGGGWKFFKKIAFLFRQNEFNHHLLQAVQLLNFNFAEYAKVGTTHGCRLDEIKDVIVRFEAFKKENEDRQRKLEEFYDKLEKQERRIGEINHGIQIHFKEVDRLLENGSDWKRLERQVLESSDRCNLTAMEVKYFAERVLEFEDKWESLQRLVAKLSEEVSGVVERVEKNEELQISAIGEVKLELKRNDTLGVDLLKRIDEFNSKMMEFEDSREQLSNRWGDLQKRLELALGGLEPKVEAMKIETERQKLEHLEMRSILDEISRTGREREDRDKADAEKLGKLEKLIESDAIKQVLNEFKIRCDSVKEKRNFYKFFEDLFRGPFSEIKEKQRHHLERIRKWANEKGRTPQDIQILDLGCGRGEFLSLIKEEGFHAEGVDWSDSMEATHRNLGIKVTYIDVLQFLERRESESFDVVTAFHLIEHFSWDRQFLLMHEIRRIMKSGGLLILETPNASSVKAFHWNYLSDPTHIQPMNPQLMKGLMEYFGFRYQIITGESRYPDAELIRSPQIEEEDRNKLNYLLYGEQDLIIVGQK